MVWRKCRAGPLWARSGSVRLSSPRRAAWRRRAHRMFVCSALRWAASLAHPTTWGRLTRHSRPRDAPARAQSGPAGLAARSPPPLGLIRASYWRNEEAANWGGLGASHEPAAQAFLGMVRLHTLMVAMLLGQRWRPHSLESSIRRVARCVPPSHPISRGCNRGAACLAFDRLDCPPVAAKRGHLKIQKGPVGV